MPHFPTPLRISGEITERAELLNGAMQLALDGESDPDAGEWIIEVALSWRLGRAGAVALDEGDCSADCEDLAGASAELVAVLEQGTAELDPDTGRVEIEATFTIEGVTGLEDEPGTMLRARFEIGAETWTGELRRSVEP
ncbi:MAG: hypothetical protein O3A10_12370 [Chloroflexi bacterium]|nr:hypothetical protein [Chloroflexota bacterium]MDA1146236.1 hypothetical protein [Chloroflexota bacterium]